MAEYVKPDTDILSSAFPDRSGEGWGGGGVGKGLLSTYNVWAPYRCNAELCFSLYVDCNLYKIKQNCKVFNNMELVVHGVMSKII
jgi:hypothetical protein